MKDKLGFVVGAVVGDGSLYSRPEIGDFTIEIEQKNREWLENLREVFKELFNKEPKISERKTKKVFRLRLHCKKTFEVLEEFHKNLTNILLEDEKFQLGFLRGICDAEGSVHPTKNRVTISNKKSKVLFICKKILHKLGIKTGKVWEDKNGVKILPINGKENLLKFKEIVNFTHPDKKRKLEQKFVIYS